MRTKHLTMRGTRYYYRCRIPHDLNHLFPSPAITKALGTESEKDARTAATAIEYRTQKLFMQLRTGMLSPELQQRIIALYLNSHTTALKAAATGLQFDGTPQDETGLSVIFDQHARGQMEYDQLTATSDRSHGVTRQETIERQINESDESAKQIKAGLPLKAGSLTHYFDFVRIKEQLRKKMKIKLSEEEEKALQLELSNAESQIYQVKSATLRGEWEPLEQLQQKASNELSKSFYMLGDVLKKYQEWYLVSNPDIKPGSKDDMIVECGVLFEIFGNIRLTEFNSMESVTKLKRTLKKYPLNRKQKYRDKSLNSILRQESGYKVIGAKTANNYIQRAIAVIEFALKFEILDSTNKYKGERFRTDQAAEEQRLAYDEQDIRRLIDAICTQPLYKNNPARPERFWIILIAMFHGLRLGNIVKLTKRDVIQLDSGMWCFSLRQGKTKSTVRPVAICDALLLLGFLEWIEKLDRTKLFQDTSSTFSTFYNRAEPRNGKMYYGFEGLYVTTNPKKCLYSLRHTFAGSVFEVTDDFKITSDMMGHATSRSMTARYTKATKAAKQKEVADMMKLDHIDLDRLEARAKELFDL